MKSFSRGRFLSRVMLAVACAPLIACSAPHDAHLDTDPRAQSETPTDTTSSGIGDADASDPSRDVALRGLPALTGHEWVEPVLSQGHEIGAVSIPQGTTTARPWILALHGSGDRAGWACGEWRGVTSAYPFIVCPHGAASRVYWDDVKTTAKQAEDARGATEEKFAPYMQDGPRVIVGFSSGAYMTVSLLQNGATPEAIVLVEGAYDSVSSAGFASLLKQHGVKRVLLGCSTSGTCTRTFADAVPRLTRAGIDVRANFAPAGAHGMWNEVVESLRRDWPWLVSGIAGWQSYAPPIEQNLPGKTILPAT